MFDWSLLATPTPGLLEAPGATAARPVLAAPRLEGPDSYAEAVEAGDVSGETPEADTAAPPMAAWQRRRLGVAAELLKSDPDLSLAALATGLQAHGHEVT